MEKHLGRWAQRGCVRRNFSFWWRWRRPSGEESFKPIDGSVKRASRGWRYDEWVRSPFERRSVPIVRVACMVKCHRQTTALMDGLVADHNNGTRGWGVVDWRLLRVIPADEDPDRGWH